MRIPTGLMEELDEAAESEQQPKAEQQSAVKVQPEDNLLYPLLHRLIRTPAFWVWAQRVTMALLGLTALLVWLLAK
ncbi:hypothetical protein ACFQ2M_00025 [Kitasatospora saccharophila]